MAKPKLKEFQANPVAFFNALKIPSAYGNKRFAEVMAPYQRDWFATVAPSLLAVAKGETPPLTRFWVERTKGGSKDMDIACGIVWLLAFSRKLEIEVGAADKDQANEVRKAAEDILRLNGWLASRIRVQSYSLICDATGSECLVRAADIAGSHGTRPDVVLANELSHVTKQEFIQNMMDNLTKKPNGLGIIATNAGFLESWQHEWRQIAEESDRWHFHTMSQPVPWLSETELKEASRRSSTARFNRLFHGVWASQSGDCLDQEDIDACTDPSLETLSRRLPGNDWFYVGGLDLGWKHDYSAFSVIAANRRTQQMQVAFAQSWQANAATGKVDLVQIEEIVAAVHKRFKLKILRYDPTQAILLTQRLEQQRVPTEEVSFASPKNLNEMATALIDTFRSRRIRMPQNPELTTGLQRLTLLEKSYGLKLEAARTTDLGHCDLAISLAIGLPYAIAQLGKRKREVPYDFFKGDPNLSPYEQALRDLDERQRRHQEEMEQLWRGGDDTREKEQQLMAVLSRGRRCHYPF